jgi:hypothetical protein
VSRNCAKKSSSAPVAVRGGNEGGVRGVLKEKGLRGDDDDWDDEVVVNADGAEFKTSRLKKSSTVGSNEKGCAAAGVSVSIIDGFEFCGWWSLGVEVVILDEDRNESKSRAGLLEDGGCG